MANKNPITYRRVGDYIIPNLILPHEEANIRFGKWGMLHKNYLEEHNRVLFNLLLAQGKLYQHCAEDENRARDLFNTLIEQIKNIDGATEQLKEENQMEWICPMQNIEAQIRAIVCAESNYKYQKT